MTLTIRDQWKMEVGGLAFSRVDKGFEKDINMNMIEIASPMHVY